MRLDPPRIRPTHRTRPLLFLVLPVLLASLADLAPARAEGWLARLQGPDPTDRLAARLDLAALPADAKARQEEIATALASPQPWTRRAAVAILGEAEVDPVWAAGALITALADPDETVTAHAVVALGKLGAPAVEPLIAFLRRDSETPVAVTLEENRARRIWVADRAGAALRIAAAATPERIEQELVWAIQRFRKAFDIPDGEGVPWPAAVMFHLRRMGAEELYLMRIADVRREIGLVAPAAPCGITTGASVAWKLWVLGGCPGDSTADSRTARARTSARGAAADAAAADALRNVQGEGLAARRELAARVTAALDGSDAASREVASRRAWEVADLLPSPRLVRLLAAEPSSASPAALELVRRREVTPAVLEALARALDPAPPRATWGDVEQARRLACEAAALLGSEARPLGDRLLALAAAPERRPSRLDALRALPRVLGADPRVVEVLAAAADPGSRFRSPSEVALPDETARAALSAVDPPFALAAANVARLLDAGGETADWAAGILTAAANREKARPPELDALLQGRDARLRAAVLAEARPGLFLPAEEDALLAEIATQDAAAAVGAAARHAGERPEALLALLDRLPRPGGLLDAGVYAALGELPPATAPPATVPAAVAARLGVELERLRALTRQGDGKQRLAALAAFAALGPWTERVVDGLAPATADANPVVRAAAAAALAGRVDAGEAAAARVRGLLWDPVRKVREEAEKALLARAQALPRPSPADLALLVDASVTARVGDELFSAKQALFDSASPSPPPERRLDLPWPPPAYSAEEILPTTVYRGAGVRHGDVEAWLRAVLTDAGFEGSRRFGVPGGFAIVAPVERIDGKGDALGSRALGSRALGSRGERWPSARLRAPTFDFGSVATELFLAPPGDFRVVAFLVVPERELPAVAASRSTPFAPFDGLAPTALGDGYVHAVVYHFRKQDGRVELLVPSPLPVSRHLQGAGLARGLASFP